MRFDLFRSRLFKGIGILAGAYVVVLSTSFPASAGPVRVDFSGHTDPLELVNFLLPGNAVYSAELEAAIPTGSSFSGSFVYDPSAPATTIPLTGSSAGYGFAYQGLISSVNVSLARAGGGYFTPDEILGILSVINDQPLPPSDYVDTLGFALAYLSPDVPGVPGVPGYTGMLAALQFTDFSGLAPDGLTDIVGDVTPPSDLEGAFSRAFLQGTVFEVFTEQGPAGVAGHLDTLTVTPLDVPEPAPLGLMLLGIAYVIRRRLRG